MIYRRSLPIASVALLGLAATANAQAPAVKEAKPGLLAMARITPDSATQVAQARIPDGRIQSAEIEMEDGHLIYSFDLKIAGKSGLDEVNVDAKTGTVIAVEHEGPKAEAAERKADSLKARVKP